MAYDDFDVVVYKLLSYYYGCIKAGVAPSLTKSKEVARVNEIYFSAVIRSLFDSGYVTGVRTGAWGGDTVLLEDVAITQAGAAYLSENSKMAKVRKFLGSAFDKALMVAIEATKAL
ncbi:MAG: YjcQ family protein [Coriobacteriales bacterium]|jgi:hypothetical protein|nr:YjcQ family protein [Coriobacteriales bacterium]